MREWYGGVPAHWGRARVKSVAERVTDGAHISPDTEDGVYDFVSTRDVKGGRINYAGALKTSSETYEYMVKTGCRPNRGDVLFSKDGTVGETAIVMEQREFAVASSLVIITPRPSVITPSYLAHVFASRPAQEQAASFMRGAGLPRLSVGNLARLEVLVPPLEEQHAIADYLDRETARIDTLIGEQQRLIEVLRERRRATVRLAIADIDADRAALRHFTRIVSGSGFPVEAQGQSGQELPFFKVKDLKTADVSGVLLPAEDTISRETAASLRAAVIPRGALVFAKVGAALMLGRVAALPADGCIDNNMSALIFNTTFDANFARYLMLTFDFPQFVQPGAVPSLNMNGLREFRVPLIPLRQQREIATYLDEQTAKIDTLIGETRRFIDLSHERRAALITAAVTGQIDVREVA